MALPRMIFHAPYLLNRRATSASGIRPVALADAFAAIGYDVWQVTGSSAERALEAAKVRRALARGVSFEFCYSESSTMPMTMTDPHHLPLRPWLDRGFFRALRRAGVPTGQFLRDIYWAFPEYRASVRPPKREAALAAYALDLDTLRRYTDVLFLPSVAMADYVDTGALRVEAMPPAHSVGVPEQGPSSGAHLVYVGGLGGHYRLEKLCEAVTRAASSGADVSLTICTSADLWARERAHYEPLMGPTIRVVHESGAGLLPLYRSANVASLFVEPDEYRTFAMPVKLFEYIGQAKPILATRGTLAGEFVAANGAGWVLPWDADECASLLADLAARPGAIDEARRGVLAMRDAHTWEHRARTIASVLAGSS